MQKLYADLAHWWPLLDAPVDYAEEAALYTRLLQEHCKPTTPPRDRLSLLEIGSGGGNNALHMKADFTVTLVDLSPGMLDVSRALNPECEHLQGDMRTVRLNRVFDCVFIHDAIVYMTNAADLRQAVDTAYVHCRPGGAVLLAPDHVRETFREQTDHGGTDGGDGRAMRYLEWTWDPDPDDDQYTVDYSYMLREPDGAIRVEKDRHEEGLFSRDTWLQLVEAAGFVDARSVPGDLSDVPAGDYEVFVATRPL